MIYLIRYRYCISDSTLIAILKSLAYLAQDDQVICQQILSTDSSLNELFDYLNYPHKGIKVQVSSILASLLKNSESLKSMAKVGENENLLTNIRELHSSNTVYIFHNILIELMN